MRIVFLNPSGQMGGAERVLLDVLASLRAARPDWDLRLVTSADGPVLDRARALGVGTKVIGFPRALSRIGDGGVARGSALGSVVALLRGALASMRYLARLRGELRELAPDLIHTNGFKMHVLGLRARPRATPVVWHVHDFVARRPLMSWLLRSHASRCAAVIANSRSVAADVESVVGGRVEVHPVVNAVDVARFSPDGPRLDLDAAAGMAPVAGDVVRVGLVATLGWWKGHETFLRALSLLPGDLPVRGYVVGGALYETAGSQWSLDDLRRRADELGLTERLGFTGYVPDPASAMRSLDVVVHASTEPEPFGLVIAEAMACGRAAVVSEAGGAAELFTPGVEALGHRPGDAEELATRIEELVRNPELRARLARAGRARAARSFDRSRLATELIPIYMAARESAR